MKIEIDNKEYELKPITTKIYLDILYSVYYTQVEFDAASIENQIDLMIDSTGAEKEIVVGLHPEIFLQLIEKIVDHYSKDPFWGTPKKEDKPKIIKMKKK